MATALQIRIYESRIEWPPGRGTHFIPTDVLDLLITYYNVENELHGLYPAIGKRELKFITDFIYRKAKKIFTILLYIEQLRSIFQIIDEGICDDDLPFTRCYTSSTAQVLATCGPYILCKRSRKCSLGSNHQDCGIKGLTKWHQRAIDNFNREQWLVQAPVFKKNEDGSIPYYDLDSNTILPFIDDYELRSDQTASGGYSHVWRVRIHPAHQNFYDSSCASNLFAPKSIKADIPLVAIKRLLSRNLLDIQRETDMLCTLATKEHPHLIRLFAIYKFNEQYHLIFPYAAFHLRNYWNMTSLPNWNRDTYLWTINQLHGLASGLSTIHEPSLLSTDQMFKMPLGPLRARSGIVEPVERFGRHGDIKAENILWFNDPRSSVGEGILQITDMGLGRFHRLGSRSTVNPHGLSGSPTYCPPEIALGLHVSRAYDIWTLGCVFLEFITWLLEGSSSIYEFSSMRLLNVSPDFWDDCFFTTFTNDYSEKQAKVREGVETWIIRLRETERCSQMVDDVLTLVHTQMLAIESKKRIRSEQLVRELERLLDRATNDGIYLLGQNPTSSHQGLGMKKPQQSSPGMT